MNKNEKIVSSPSTKGEPRTSAESLYTVRPDLIGHLSRIHLLSLRGAAGDVAISCDKALSSRGRAESSDVVISCDKALSFLSRCCASANQGISAPASCREAHKRRFLFNSKIPGIFRLTAKNRDDSFFVASPRYSLKKIATSAFRLLAKTPVTLALAMVLSMGILNESKADCKALKDGWSSSCITLKESGTCGKGCSYTYDSASKTVNITATGNNARISDNTFDSRYYEHNIMPAQKFVINGAVTIGSNAFTSSSEVISGANGALILTGVEHHAFGDYATLSGTIIIPAGATFGSIAFHGVTWAEDAKIYCGAEDCRQKMIDSCNAFNGTSYQQRCRNVVDNIVSSGRLLPYPSGCLEMGTTGCTKCKNGNFRLNDGECDRLRYTPAEAAKYLKDTDNEIIMTFKVNR